MLYLEIKKKYTENILVLSSLDLIFNLYSTTK